MLGAGIDLFASGRPNLLDRIGVFEVDPPSGIGRNRQEYSPRDWSSRLTTILSSQTSRTSLPWMPPPVLASILRARLWCSFRQ